MSNLQIDFRDGTNDCMYKERSLFTQAVFQGPGIAVCRQKMSCPPESLFCGNEKLIGCRIFIASVQRFGKT
jgi:hypothetical protein